CATRRRVGRDSTRGMLAGKAEDRYRRKVRNERETIGGGGGNTRRGGASEPRFPSLPLATSWRRGPRRPPRADRINLSGELDLVGEPRQQDDDAILEILERHGAIELSEQGVRESGVIPRRHVAQTLDQHLEEEGLSD